MSQIIQFDEAGSLDLDIVGGKSASLARLSQADFPVPPGFTITTEAYAAFLGENGLADKIAAIAKDLAYDDFDDLERKTEEIRTVIESGLLPAGLEASIEKYYRTLGDEVRVAVRSSATAVSNSPGLPKVIKVIWAA